MVKALLRIHLEAGRADLHARRPHVADVG